MPAHSHQRPVRVAVRALRRLTGDDAAGEIPAVAAILTRWAEFRRVNRRAVGKWLGERLAGEIADELTAVVRQWPAEWFADDCLPGWAFQFLRDAQRERVRENFVRSQVKAAPADLPLVTQVYTPAFMVDWLLRRALTSGDWRTKTIFDPAAGTGHILVGAYRGLHARAVAANSGKARGAVAASIVREQIFGFDIDPIAIAIAEFTLRALAVGDGAAWAETAGIQVAAPEAFATGGKVADTFATANVQPLGAKRAEKWPLETAMAFAAANPRIVGAVVPREWRDVPVHPMLRGRYAIVATNPPFLDRRDLSPAMLGYLKTACPLGGGKNLFAAFVERIGDWLIEAPTADGEPGCAAVVLPQPFGFVPAFAKVRREFLQQFSPRQIAHFGLNAFEFATVDTLCLVAGRRQSQAADVCECVRLVDAADPETDLARASAGKLPGRVFAVSPAEFSRHPRSAFVYWTPPRVAAHLSHGERLGRVAKSRQGMSSNDNGRFLRHWWEVPADEIGPGKRWVMYAKGGPFGRWAGNLTRVILWENNGAEVRQLARERYSTESRTVKNQSYFFAPGLTYTLVSSKGFSARVLPEGCIFDVGGACTFPPAELRGAVLAYLNSFFVRYLLAAINPTVNHQVGDIDALPWPKWPDDTLEALHELAVVCVNLKREWLADDPAEPRFSAPPQPSGMGLAKTDPWAMVADSPWPVALPTGAKPGHAGAKILPAKVARHREIWAMLRTFEAVADRLILRAFDSSRTAIEEMVAPFGRPHGWLPFGPDPRVPQTIADWATATVFDFSPAARTAIFDWLADLTADGFAGPISPTEPPAPAECEWDTRARGANPADVAHPVTAHLFWR